MRTMFNEEQDIRYLVMGIRYNEQDNGPFEAEIIGGFPDIGAAVICRDVYADLDTTFDDITITSVTLYEEIPEIEIFLNFTTDDDHIIIRSQCMPMGTEPTLKDDSSYFEAVAYLDDRDDMLDYAARWFMKYKKKRPKVIDLTSPSVESYTV